jgi:hypothetical protein
LDLADLNCSPWLQQLIGGGLWVTPAFTQLARLMAYLGTSSFMSLLCAFLLLATEK